MMSEVLRPSSLSVTAGRPPNISNQRLIQLLTSTLHFKEVNESEIKPLRSYADRNYYFRGTLDFPLISSGPANTSVTNTSLECEYVFKINNPLLANFEEIKGINFITRHLNNQGFRGIQDALSNRNGQDVFVILRDDVLEYCNLGDSADPPLAEASIYYLRVMTYIPGELYKEIDRRYITPDLLLELGSVIGRMAKELQVST